MENKFKLPLKPVQLENLIKDTIDKAMGGNAGLAIANMRRRGFEPGNDLYNLNDELVQLEINTRREMRKRIIDYLDKIKYPR